jgi:hypothetical protein
MKFPKVLIGGPNSVHKDYCLPQLKRAVDKMKEYPNCDILFTDNTYDDGQFAHKMRRMGIPAIHLKPENKDVPTRKRLIDCRNYLREKAIRENYDYFFSFESDLEPLYPDNVNIVQRLISHGKQIVSGVYSSLKCSRGMRECTKCNKYYADTPGMAVVGQQKCNKCGKELKIHKSKWIELPMAWTWADPKVKDSDLIRMHSLHTLYDTAYKSGNTLIPVQSTGVGALMIHKSVLKDIEFRYIPERLSCDDMFFAIDCRAHNPPFDIFLDTEVVLRHNYREWSGKFKTNR